MRYVKGLWVKGCMKKLLESVRRTCVGADLSRPQPIDRPCQQADQSAVGAINRPLLHISVLVFLALWEHLWVCLIEDYLPWPVLPVFCVGAPAGRLVRRRDRSRRWFATL